MPLFRAALRAVTLLAFTATVVLVSATDDTTNAVQCTYGGYDLSRIPLASPTINQQYGSQPLKPYTWVVSICQPVSMPPNGAPVCKDKAGNTLAGFVSEYSTSACETAWSIGPTAVASNQQVVLTYGETANANNPGWTAVVTLTCGGGTDPTLVPQGNVVVTGSSTASLQFAFSFTTAAVCGGNPAPPPPVTPTPAGTPSPPETNVPVLPQYFQGLFTEYTSYDDTVGPPYVNGVPPAPLVASRGRVYYDWDLQNMIEVREDYCVNIFPEGGHHFPCVFQNVNGTSYLITYNRSKVLPACCVFGKPWYPPEPDFLRVNVSTEFYGTAPWNSGAALWYKIPSIPPPTGPFFYSFNASLPTTIPQVYTSFAFPGMTGWVQQAFYSISNTKPDVSVWDLPEICLPLETLPTCDFFGSQSGSSSSGSGGRG